VQPTPEPLILLGCLLMAGLVAHVLGRATAVPRVSLLLLCGLAVGPAGLDLLPDLSRAWFRDVSTMALVMVGFLLGGELTLAELRKHGRGVIVISISVVVLTLLVVFAGLRLAGQPWLEALVLGVVATATDPASTADVVRESGAKGPFSRTLLGIVAIDDAWGLIAFSLALAVVPLVTGSGGILEALGHGAWEIGGAVLVGALIGVPMAYLSGRLKEGEPTQAEALGGVLLCGGVALWLGASYLLASVVLGMVVANLGRHHTRAFHEIEGIEWPFMTVLFVLAGASLELETLRAVGVLGLGYIVLRVLGRLAGGWAGARLAGADDAQRRWMGLSLTPQAGVAIGVTLAATQSHPELRENVLPVVLGSTVVFELIGPLLTRFSLSRAGESGAGAD